MGSLIQHYTLQARAETVDDMRRALSDLKTAVAPLSGVISVQLLEDVKKAGCFVFIEAWRSLEDHTSASKLLPPDVMAAIRNAAATPPTVLRLSEV